MKNLGLFLSAVLLLMTSAVSAQQVVSLAIGDFNVAKSSSESQLVTEISRTLVDTRKFSVSEFSKLEEILSLEGHDPKKFVNRKNAPSDLLDKSNIDYLLQGSVRDLSNGSTKVNVELVKIARDGKPLINTNGVLSATYKPVADLSDQEQAAQMIRDLVIASLYPVRVVSTSDENELMLNYGEGLLDVGDVLSVSSDPEKLDASSLPLKLEVTRVGKKFSYARLLEGDQDIENGVVLRTTDDNTVLVNATDSTIQTLY